MFTPHQSLFRTNIYLRDIVSTDESTWCVNFHATLDETLSIPRISLILFICFYPIDKLSSQMYFDLLKMQQDLSWFNGILEIQMNVNKLAALSGCS